MRPELAVTRERIGSALMALRADTSGATAIEYALIAGLISVSIIVWAMSMGTAVSTMFTSIASGL